MLIKHPANGCRFPALILKRSQGSTTHVFPTFSFSRGNQKALRFCRSFVSCMILDHTTCWVLVAISRFLKLLLPKSFPRGGLFLLSVKNKRNRFQDSEVQVTKHVVFVSSTRQRSCGSCKITLCCRLREKPHAQL